MEENHDSEEIFEGSKRELLKRWEQADDETRELLKPLFKLAGMPIPFTFPAPPEDVTPALAVPALTKLIHQCQALARENVRVMLGIRKVNENLGNRMLTEAHQALATYQQILEEIIAQIQQGGWQDK